MGIFTLLTYANIDKLGLIGASKHVNINVVVELTIV